jgi:rhamnosyltransferase
MDTLAGTRIAAVVVAFHPDPGFLARLRTVEDQVGRLIVVDNTPAGHGGAVLGERAEAGRYELLRQGRNTGVAAALNTGIRCAARAGYGFVLLLDQDTVLYPDAAARLVAIREEHPRPDRVAVVGANYETEVAGRPLLVAAWPRRDGWEETSAVITSGSLVSVACFERIGPFAERFFIDMVDFEYCLRARRAGLLVLRSGEPLMRHEVGRPSLFSFAGIKMTLPNHAPIRLFYRGRNLTRLTLEYGAREPSFIAREWRAFAVGTLRSFLGEDKGWAKLGAALRGVASGLLSRGAGLGRPGGLGGA